MYSYTHGRVNFNIFNEVDAGVGNLSRIVDTMLPRTYSQFQRSLFLLAIEPHVECTEDVILDVFRVTNTATISFNFYESCASAVPCLRKLLQAHLQHLPREVSLRGQLTSSHVELSRPWAFEDGIGSTFDKSKMYTVQRPLGTLKRYIIKRMYISFEDGGMHLLDTLLNPFRECIASAVAEKVVVYGFSKVPSVYREQMERIIECLCLMEIEYKLRFRFTELGHLRTFCRNIRDFPKAKRLKISLVKEEGDELPDGEALAEALRALTRSRHPVRAYDNVEIDVSRVINPAAALRPMLEILSSDWRPRRLHFFLRDVLFDGTEMYLLGQHGTITDAYHMFGGK